MTYKDKYPEATVTFEDKGEGEYYQVAYNTGSITTHSEMQALARADACGLDFEKGKTLVYFLEPEGIHFFLASLYGLREASTFPEEIAILLLQV